MNLTFLELNNNVSANHFSCILNMNQLTSRNNLEDSLKQSKDIIVYIMKGELSVCVLILYVREFFFSTFPTDGGTVQRATGASPHSTCFQRDSDC